jgi:hypothetical protein
MLAAFLSTPFDPEEAALVERLELADPGGGRVPGDPAARPASPEP